MRQSRRLSTILAIALCAIMGSRLQAQFNPGVAANDDPRIEQLLGKLTLEEKISLLGGTGFDTKPIERLGIPPLSMTDGPVGVRWGKSTAFPVSIMMAAGWNPAVVEKVGAALGREAKAKGRHMLLGPCVNIHRTPFGGRNFESYGEDPYLAARNAVAYVRGVQSEKVVATVKHFACNNQEFERDFTNVSVDERALREIYLPAFEAAVTEGGAMSVMSAYNKVNGKWCSENPHLLTEILKDDWKFPGFVVSDWGAVHSVVPTANAGLDVEMPEGAHLNADSLLPALKRGEVTVATIDDKVRRLLRTMIWAGLFDGKLKDKGAMDTPDHRATSLEAAREGIVLLKNEGNALPLSATALKSIAVIGPNAAVARTGGGGSSKVEPVYAVSTLEALKKKLGSTVEIRFAQGCRSAGDINVVPSEALVPAGGQPGVHGMKGEYFANRTLEGPPVLTRNDPQLNFYWDNASPGPSVPSDNFSVRWTGSLVAPKTGRYTLQTVSDDGVRVHLDGKLIMEEWNDHSSLLKSADVALEAGKSYPLIIEFYQHIGGACLRFGWSSMEDTMIAEAVQAAKGADAAILCVGLSQFIESEGFDRQSLGLSDDQEKLVSAVAAVNNKTIVVLNSGAPVTMDSWIGGVAAIVEAWFPGTEGGTAVAEVLLGDCNPSGKLPMTFPHRWEDSPAFGNYPGSAAVSYEEGMYVGYRGFDKSNRDVLFPFGHGLSYTSFAYTGLTVKKQKSSETAVTLTVRNTGTRAGAEVVQVYIHGPATGLDRPLKELKAFQKVRLRPGDAKAITLTLNERSFALYDVARKNWKVEPGVYEIMVGSSSRDIRARTTLTLE